MIGLLLLGFGAVAAFATYELSPKVHKWVDDHFRHAAEADAHLDAAVATADPSIAAAHVEAAAEKTAQMAQTAMTPQQKAATVQTAQRVEVTQLEVWKRMLDVAIRRRDRLLSHEDWLGSPISQQLALDEAHAAIASIMAKLPYPKAS